MALPFFGIGLDLPYPGVEPGSPVLQADSLPTELSGKPIYIPIKHIYLGKSGKSIVDKHHDPLSLKHLGLISPYMNATLLKK